ncbi:MAG: hypothetical protein HQ559_08870 [Lentisphaerae bacterium]|nr:hypothetical protein [Lentisphaerota bacterium]
MIKKSKPIGNPLTLIAAFAALAQVAMTGGLALVSPELQSTLLCFIIGFPVLLVILFFATLNFNYRVLYAPRDFADESNFVKLISPEPPVDISHGVCVDVNGSASQPFTEMKTVEQIRETVTRLYNTDNAEIYATNIGYRPDDRAKSDWVVNDWAAFLYTQKGSARPFKRILSVSTTEERRAVRTMVERSTNPSYDLRIVEAPNNPLPYPNLVVAVRDEHVTAFVSFRGPRGKDRGTFAFYSDDQRFCRGLLSHIIFFHLDLPDARTCIQTWEAAGTL